jgi:hypothetical protein
MKHISSNAILIPIVLLLTLFNTTPVMAIPPLPSSFYGTVKVNGANVADGTVIQALIGDQVYAEAYTQTYQGDSVYSLDVQGDNTDTAAVDGGREGDTVKFKIGGVLAKQTGTWHSGTNAKLNLTTSSSSISAPQPTPTPVASQTAIVILVSSPVPGVATKAATTQTSPSPEAVVQSEQTSNVEPTQVVAGQNGSSPASTPGAQASFTPVASGIANHSGISSQVVIAIISILVAIGLVYLVWNSRRKKA